MIKVLNDMFNRLLKKAELMLENQQQFSILMDNAFVKMGQFTEQFYDVQDQSMGLLRMLNAWMKREYTNVSPKAILSMLAAVIYFVNPFDLISDYLPVVGLMDDITLITYVVTTFNKEIERFMVWEQTTVKSNN
jgi:uncharacterized membrane protein YkvA (DUF1232 family)